MNAKVLTERWAWGIGLAVVAGLLAVAGLMTACESTTGTEGVGGFFDRNPVNIQAGRIGGVVMLTLDPEAATLVQDGDTVVMRVQGGEDPYSWSVLESSKGSILRQEAAAAVYERSAAGENVVVCTDSRGQSVYAVITQPAGADEETPEIPPLVLDPKDVTLANNNDRATISAKGGKAPYTWSVDNAAQGDIVVPGTDSAVYERLATGDNIVICRDSSGNTAFTTVKQPPEAAPPVDQMLLDPANPTLSADGNTVVIKVKGGEGPYTWGVNDPTRGVIIEEGSDSVVYRRTLAGDNVVRCTDSKGTIVFSIIEQP